MVVAVVEERAGLYYYIVKLWVALTPLGLAHKSLANSSSTQSIEYAAAAAALLVRCTNTDTHRE